MPAENEKRVLLVDTSVLIDCFKFKEREEYFKSVAAGFTWTFTTDIALLEFKAVLIQEMVTIHSELVRSESFTRTQFRLTESTHRQHRLRAHIFANFINVYGSSFEVSEAEDKKLAERARLCLEPRILWAYKKFLRMTGSIQKTIGCDRAIEEPKKQRKTYDANLPICKRGKNKTCTVESFIRGTVAPRTAEIRAAAASGESEQLLKACELTDKVVGDNAIDLASKDCRVAGDCLIVLDGKIATHTMSTNKREWEPLSMLIDAESVTVDYPDRR